MTLEIHSLFQPAPKIYRRLKSSLNLQALESYKPGSPRPATDATLVPSSADKFRIRGILTTNENGQKVHRLLYVFLRKRPLDPRHWLPLFHSFFVWFLQAVRFQLQQLSVLRTSSISPPELPKSLVNLTFSNLNVMRFFAWESEFFASYIRSVTSWGIQCVSREVPRDAASSKEAQELEFHAETEQQEKSEEDGSRLDISTEFETGENDPSSAVIQPAIHPCIVELRRVSSNIQHIKTLLQRVPKSRFRFEVIQYAPSGKMLKPWRDLIHELFRNTDVEAKVLKALQEAPGKQFAAFRPGGPSLAVSTA